MIALNETNKDPAVIVLIVFMRKQTVSQQTNKVISNIGMCSEDNAWRDVMALGVVESCSNCTRWSWEVTKRTCEQTCKTRGHLPGEGEGSAQAE